MGNDFLHKKVHLHGETPNEWMKVHQGTNATCHCRSIGNPIVPSCIVAPRMEMGTGLKNSRSVKPGCQKNGNNRYKA